MEVVGRAELPAGDLDRAVRIEPELREPLEEDPPRGAGLVAAEPRADAAVRPGGEREVCPLAAMDVEPVRIRPAPLVAVGRREDRGDERALLELHTAKLRVARRLAGRRPDRRMPAGTLLDRLVDQLGLRFDLVRLLGMREERPERE